MMGNRDVGQNVFFDPREGELNGHAGIDERPKNSKSVGNPLRQRSPLGGHGRRSDLSQPNFFRSIRFAVMKNSNQKLLTWEVSKLTAAWTFTRFSFLFGSGYENTSINLDIPIDVNGDGLQDLVVARLADFSGTSGHPPVPITILLNEGQGHFEDATNTFFPGGAPTVRGPGTETIADFNGDGRPDLFIGDEGLDVGPSRPAQATQAARIIFSFRRARMAL